MNGQQQGVRAAGRVIAIVAIAALLTAVLPSPGNTHTETAQATTITGKVVRVEERTVHIEIESELWPRAGDRARLCQSIPGYDELVCLPGTWTITEIAADQVVAEPDPQVLGQPALDYIAEIESENPQRRPVAEQGTVATEIPEWRRQQMAAASISWMLADAEGGDVDTQFALADNYYFGNFVPQDRQFAARWFRAAADQGHGQAMVMLGFMYEKGEGVERDGAAAFSWYSRSAATDNPDGYAYLAGVYEAGIGVEHNLELATENYKQAARRGQQRAQDWLLARGIPW